MDNLLRATRADPKFEHSPASLSQLEELAAETGLDVRHLEAILSGEDYLLKYTTDMSGAIQSEILDCVDTISVHLIKNPTWEEYINVRSDIFKLAQLYLNKLGDIHISVSLGVIGGVIKSKFSDILYKIIDYDRYIPILPFYDKFFRVIIDQDAPQPFAYLPLEERVERLRAISDRLSPKEFYSYAKSLIPEAFKEADKVRIELPETAPALWITDKESGDTPTTFIQRHYGPWLGGDLTSAELRRLDRSLYQSYYKHIERYPDAALDLPKRESDTGAWVERVLAGDPDAQNEAREMQRRLTALTRSRARAKK